MAAKQVLVPCEVGAFRVHGASKTATLWPTFVKEAHQVRLQYAKTPSQKFATYFGSALHWGVWPIWRVRHTPTYRKLRKRIVRVTSMLAMSSSLSKRA
jgi:hypothetical protein